MTGNVFSSAKAEKEINEEASKDHADLRQKDKISFFI
jgi:hypothetical protein